MFTKLSNIILLMIVTVFSLYNDSIAQKIEGYILDYSNHPVENALVSLKDATISVKTDSKGFFSIDVNNQQKIPQTPTQSYAIQNRKLNNIPLRNRIQRPQANKNPMNNNRGDRNSNSMYRGRSNSVTNRSNDRSFNSDRIPQNRPIRPYRSQSNIATFRDRSIDNAYRDNRSSSTIRSQTPQRINRNQSTRSLGRDQLTSTRTPYRGRRTISTLRNQPTSSRTYNQRKSTLNTVNKSDILLINAMGKTYRVVVDWNNTKRNANLTFNINVATTKSTESNTVNPAFVRKMKNNDFVVNPYTLESICGTNELQHVAYYDNRFFPMGFDVSFVTLNEPAVGAMKQNNSVSVNGYCSGTLIDRDLFLTASHCVDQYTVGDYIAFNYQKKKEVPVCRYRLSTKLLTLLKMAMIWNLLETTQY